MTNHIGVEINERDISDIHRLPSLTESNGIKTPGIIVRVNRRRVKYGVMDNKKQLRSRPHPEYPNVGIYEDLTPLRSRMLYALRNRKNDQGTNNLNIRGPRKVGYSAELNSRQDQLAMAKKCLNLV